MNSIKNTPEFDKWLLELRDSTARAAIVGRLKRAMFGNFGDYESVGEGVYEMRIHIGPGYRVYYFQEGDTIYIVTNGGDKRTQQRDIRWAKEVARNLKKG